MTEEERVAASEAVRLSVSALVTWMAPRFPHQSSAIRQELGRARMTTDRWNRVAALLASLLSVPGEALAGGEHAVRNIALHGIAVAQKMAASGMGNARDPDGCVDIAAWIAARIRKMMEAHDA